MNNFALAVSLSNLVLGLTLVNSPLVQAATMKYDFQVDIDSGILSGDSFEGSFSFKKTSLTNSGDEFLPLDSIDFSFQGTDYTEVNIPGAEVAFVNGEFVGLGYSSDDSLAFIPGFFRIDEASFAYDIPDFGSGLGNVSYNINNTTETTPESSSIFGLLSLGVLGVTLQKVRGKSLLGKRY